MSSQLLFYESNLKDGRFGSCQIMAMQIVPLEVKPLKMRFIEFDEVIFEQYKNEVRPRSIPDSIV